MTNRMAQAADRNSPSHKPGSMGINEIENLLPVAQANEAANSAQNRVPSDADRVRSLDIRRHYHTRAKPHSLNLAPDKSGDLNGSTQHSTRAHIALKTKAKDSD
jgi:hypothetical protein